MNSKTVLQSIFKASQPIGVAIIYFIIAFSWILVSDKIVELITNDLNTLSIFQSIKGFLFVFITTIIIYFLKKKGDFYSRRKRIHKKI